MLKGCARNGCAAQAWLAWWCAQLEAHRTIVIEAVDATHCRHYVEGEVKVRMFGIGRLAENGVIESTVKTFKQLPYVLER